ncbi:MAG: hypothetical protein LBI02_12225, partial [Opitutaceae bacterium]|nr:hypothetical protein [Opitutaceae bacterium]
MLRAAIVAQVVKLLASLGTQPAQHATRAQHKTNLEVCATTEAARNTNDSYPLQTKIPLQVGRGVPPSRERLTPIPNENHSFVGAALATP